MAAPGVPAVRRIDATHYVIGTFTVTAYDGYDGLYWRVRCGGEVDTLFSARTFDPCRIYVERTYRLNPSLPLVYRPSGR